MFKTSTMKSIITLVLVACLILSAAACTSKPAESNEPAQESAAASAEVSADTDGEKSVITIGWAAEDLKWLFHNCMLEYAERAAEELGAEKGVKFEFITTSAGSDAGQQSSDITDLINKGVDVIVTCPIDQTAIRTNIKDAHEAGIPVITTCRYENRDGAAPEEMSDMCATVDCYQQAYVSGTEMFKRMKEAGIAPEDMVGIELYGRLNDKCSADRSAGYNKAAEEAGAKIIQQSVFDWDAEKALGITSAAVVEHPEINFIMSAHDACMTAIQQALERNNRWFKTGENGHVWICGCDGDEPAMNFLKAGYIDATGNWEHGIVGEKIVSYAYDLAIGKTLESNLDALTPRVITQDNVNTEDGLWGIEYAEEN